MEAKTTALVTVKQDVRLQEWSEQIESQQASGLTVQQWCMENGIKSKTNYYHLRKVREQFLDSSPAIVPLNVPQQNEDIRIEKNGVQISLPVNISPDNIAGSGTNIMLNDLPANQQVYLATGYTDLRRSINGLAMIIQSQLYLDPFSTALFLFCGRRRDRIKGLLWEGDGFLLLYKRLDNGQFQWPRNETEAKLLTLQQTRWWLEGLMIKQPKAIREGKTGALY